MTMIFEFILFSVVAVISMTLIYLADCLRVVFGTGVVICYLAGAAIILKGGSIGLDIRSIRALMVMFGMFIEEMGFYAVLLNEPSLMRYLGGVSVMVVSFICGVVLVYG